MEKFGWAYPPGFSGPPDDDYSDDDVCEMCCGDGFVMLSECGPGEWGEDCFCEEDRAVMCPVCKGRK